MALNFFDKVLKFFSPSNLPRPPVTVKVTFKTATPLLTQDISIDTHNIVILLQQHLCFTAE
jgi:hypothetical protein